MENEIFWKEYDRKFHSYQITTQSNVNPASLKSGQNWSEGRNIKDSSYNFLQGSTELSPARITSTSRAKMKQSTLSHGCDYGDTKVQYFMKYVETGTVS